MKPIYKIFMMGMVLATVITFCVIFINAYTSDSKETLVTINDYNEANSELLILLPLSFFSAVYLTIDSFKQWMKEL